MKKVLIITYYWPPAGGPGVQRVLKFTKYLPMYGWEPIILTVKNGNFPAIDKSLSAEIPKDTIVFSLPILEPHAIYSKLLGKDSSDAIPVAVLAEKENLSFKKKLMHWIRLNIFIPDARIGWYWKASRYAKSLLKERNIDLILVSSPPHSLQLIGIKLKKVSGLPLISDFRDPWTDVHYLQNLKRLRIARYIDCRFEKKVLEQATVITTVSPSLLRSLKIKAPGSTFKVIFNGFDPEDFSELQDSDNKGKFTLAYIGNFKANQNIPSLWQALQEISTELPDFSKNFNLAITGKLNPEIEHSITQYGLERFLRYEDYVAHEEAIKRMANASALLFIIPQAKNNEGILTGKLFDYLNTNRPFLSIGPPKGDAAVILDKTKSGPMFDYEDKEGTKTYIKNLYSLWINDKLDTVRPNMNDVRKFDRKLLTKELAELMDSLLS